MTVYDYDKLIEQTRKLASDYRQSTGQSLPLTSEIARYDARRLLNLEEPPEDEAGVDAVTYVDEEIAQRYLVKGRAQIAADPSRARIGQLNMDGAWDVVVLVVLNDTYHCEAIYHASKQTIRDILKDSPPAKRGAMTVAKFKAIAECVWSATDEDTDS